jgi:hypothetical protein
LADVRRLGGGAAVDACERELGWRWRLGKRRQADESGGAQARREQGQGSQHGVLLDDI